MDTLELQAPGKVNLVLEILRRRTDGYHDLRSLLLPLSLHDRLQLERRDDGIELEAPADLTLPGIPWAQTWCRPDTNLAVRAARLLKKTAGYPGGVHIRLEKNIPVGAGLGGGSSDAAAVLKGLNHLWNLGLSAADLMSMGVLLGCDIPAFIHGGTLCMEGVGEQITPVERGDAPPLWILLVYPGFGVSTADVYRRYACGLTDADAGNRIAQVVTGLQRGDPERVAAGLFNALAPTVFAKYPLLEDIKKVLERQGALGVQLTGSGSTLFAVVRDADHGCRLGDAARAALECPIWTAVVRGV